MLDDEIETKASKILLLHSRADRVLRSRVAAELEEYKITMMEWLLMGIISEGPEDGISMSSIAQELDVTLPQVTALITNLNQKKIVRLKTQRRDRRSRHAFLTSRGSAILASLNEDITKAMKNWPADLPKSQLSGYLETIKLMAYQNSEMPG